MVKGEEEHPTTIIIHVCVCVYVCMWGSVLFKTIFSLCPHMGTPGQ